MKKPILLIFATSLAVAAAFEIDYDKVVPAVELLSKFPDKYPQLQHQTSPRLTENPQTRIVGGSEATPNSIQYQAAIYIKTHDDTGELNGFCGGIVINEWYIMTAAHCTDFPDASFTILLGLHDLNVYNSDVQVFFADLDDVTVPSGWATSTNMEYDIAVIKLDQEAVFNSFVKAAVFPPKSLASNNFVNQPCTTSGWGKTSKLPGAPLSNTLQYFNSTIISKLECTLVLAQVLDSHICVRSILKSACFGDSGGPLVIYFGGVRLLVGIVSFGSILTSVTGCGLFPSVYTRVTSHYAFIEEKTGMVIPST